MQAPERIPAGVPLPARLRAVLEQVPALVVVFRGPDLEVEFTNARPRDLAGVGDPTGRPIRDVLGPAADDPVTARYLRRLEQVRLTGEAVYGREAPFRAPGAEAAGSWDYAIMALRDPGEPPAAVVLHAVDVTRLVEARRRAETAEHRFTTLFDARVVGVTISDSEHILEANDAFLAMIGRTRAELPLDWRAISAPETRGRDDEALERLRRDGEAPAFEKEFVRPDGSHVPVLLGGSRVQTDPLRMLATAFDLTGRRSVERDVARLLDREREARIAAEHAGARTARLQAITAALSATNSTDEITRAVVHQALEALSASAGLLARGEGPLRATHAVGFEPGRLEHWQRFPATLPAPLAEAVSTGEPVLAGNPAVVADRCPDLVPLGGLAAVPLRVAGRTLGALLLAFRQPLTLGEEDRAFLVSVARLAAAALDRARLFEDRAHVARTLQEGLLPSSLAMIPGAESAVVYESISGRGEVGGDFYDLFERGPRSWVLTIGDVSGKGPEAAVVTGLARHTIRAIARLEPDPATILRFLNDELCRHAGRPAFCTVACGLVEPHPDGGFAVHLSSGGHPFPLLMRADGTVEAVAVSGTMLGVGGDPELERRDVRLCPGETLVVYTDGIVDARRPGGDRFGERRLRAALGKAAGGPAAAIAAAVEAAVRDHHPGAAADDRALLALRAI